MSVRTHRSRCRRVRSSLVDSGVRKCTGVVAVAFLRMWEICLAALASQISTDSLPLFFWDCQAIRPGGSDGPGG